MSEMNERQSAFTDDWLWQAAEVREQPFTSRVPLVGWLLAGLRDVWSRIADRPYVRPLRRHQNELNLLILQQMAEIDAWLLVQDREKVALQRETALLGNRIRQLERRLQDVKAAAQPPGRE
jgi:hypothetical protein